MLLIDSIGIIGSRTFTNKELIFSKLNIFFGKYTTKRIVSGGAKGADSLGVEYAKENNIPYKEYLPDWEANGKYAGFIRNEDIVKASSLIIAFLDNNSRGTLDSIKKAEKYEKNVIVIDQNGKVDYGLSNMREDVSKYYYEWSRVVKRGEPYYECSSNGNKEFSALYAKIDGVSIEEIYQLDIKGCRGTYEHWTDAKGKPPCNGKSEDELFNEYLKLWETYLEENLRLLNKIRREARGKTITDMFGVTPINQARALCSILNKIEHEEK